MSIANFHTASAYARAVMELNLPRESLARMISEILAIAEQKVSLLTFDIFLKLPLLSETKNFLRVVFQQNKVDQLHGIAEILKLSFLEKNKMHLVKICTAKELSIEEEGEILKELQNHFKTEILLEKTIDSSLIGGFRLFFDAYLIDFSKKAKISKIKACILK